MKEMKGMAKKLAALFLAMTMMLSMCVTVFAEDGITLTVNGGDNSLDEVTFNAYKLFDMTGAGIDDKYGYVPTAKFEQWLNDQYTGGTGNEDSVYAYVNTQMAKADTAQNFLKRLKDQIGTSIQADATASGSGYAAQFTSLSKGYYVIFSSDANYSPIAVNVTKNETVYVKVKTPSITKTAGTDNKNWADAQIGTDVPFQVNVQVPNTTGMDMNTYKFQVVDTMSKGLTFKEDTVAIQIGNTELVKEADFTVNSESVKDGTKITFDFVMESTPGEKALSQKLQTTVGKNMTISYQATLNENAVANNQETNKAELVYTNPSGIVIGGDTAPNASTKVYTYKYTVLKKAETEKGDPLEGAQFEVYKKGGSGASDTRINFVTTADSYRVATASDSVITFTLSSSAAGEIHFYGLAAGEYYLKETKAPDGYNKLKNNISFTINNDETGAQTGALSSIVVNNSGSLLPETGGAGSVAFAVIGGIVILGAAAVLIRNRKRTDA